LVKGKRVRIEGDSRNVTIKLMNGGAKDWKSKSSREQ